MKVEGHLSIAESPSSIEDGLDENSLKKPARKRRLRNKRDRNSAHEIKIIIINDIEDASLLKKRAGTERSTISSKISTKSAMKSLDGSHSEQCNKMSAAKPLATTNIIKKIKEEARNSRRHSTEPRS